MIRFNPAPILLIATMALLPLLSACTTAGTLDGASKRGASSSTQPRYANYDCGKGRKLVIENFMSSVIVVPPSGDSVELLASPPDSRTRYSVDQDTLVLDGRTAFWFQTGKTPLDCKR